MFLDGDSDEVDVSEIFSNEMSVENGEVSYDQLNLDQGSLDEMGELLNNIATKHKKKKLNSQKQNNQENDNNDKDDSNNNNEDTNQQHDEDDEEHIDSYDDFGDEDLL